MHSSISLKFFALCTFIILLVSSCSVERKYATYYVNTIQTDSIPVLFIGADYLFKQCNWASDKEKMSDNELLKIAKEQSIIINKIDDSLILENYNKAFKSRLELLGFKVFEEDELDKFISSGKDGFIMSIAQLEIQEDTAKFVDSEILGDYEYHENFDLYKVSMNCWVEISFTDSNSRDVEVFYNTNYISDKIDGVFYEDILDRNKVKYKYTRYSLTPEMINGLAVGSGKRHIENIFDFWMNTYIKRQVQTYQIEYLEYYHFDPVKKKLYIGMEDRTVKMK